MFKCIRGKNGTTPFLPLDSKKGGTVKNAKDRKAICLTEEQTRHTYTKVGLGSEIHVNTMKQETDNDILIETEIDDEQLNPYQKVVLNSV